jgi:hypothetical protein
MDERSELIESLPVRGGREGRANLQNLTVTIATMVRDPERYGEVTRVTPF